MSGTIGSGFNTTTDVDHRSWVWVASFLSLLYSLLCLAARAVSKWDFLWFDDIILAAAYISGLAHWGILFRALANGLAVSESVLSSSAIQYASRLYFASRVPFFFAHCLAKLSLLVFTRRIFAGDIYKENVIFGAGYALVVVYGILAILLSSAGCRPDDSLVASINAVCDNNRGRWAALTALDGLTEMVILAMPIWFVQKNELKASKKRIVILVYMFRVVVIGFSVATTVSYFNFLERGVTNIGIAPVLAWQEVFLGFTLISSSFPCLRSFLWAFMSRGLVTMYGNTIDYASSPEASRSASVQLRSLNSDPQVSRSVSRFAAYRIRPEQLEYRVNVRGDAPLAKRNSDDSDRMIIRHEQSFRVDSISEPRE